MPGKPLARRLGDRVQKREVVSRGYDRDMAHRGGQGGEFGLDVGAGVVPTQQDTQGVCVTIIPISE